MYFFFVILVLLLLLFNLNPIPGKPYHNHFVLIWTWKKFQLIQILPQNWYVLVDHGILYSYEPTEALDTYIPAIRLDTHRRHDIFHYRYLLDWIKEAPIAKAYSPHLKDLVDILNQVTASL